MTRATSFLAGRDSAEMYDTYVVPGFMIPFVRDLVRYVGTGDRVLDLGCGTGVVARMAAERAGDAGSVVGLDPTDFMLDAARAQSAGSNILWKEGTGEDIPFADSSFDILICHQGWQYLSDRDAAFGEMRRVLRPGGLLVGSVWSGPGEQPAFGPLERGFGLYLGNQFVPMHGMTFGGREALRTVAEGAGFSVRSVDAQIRSCSCDSVEEFAMIFIAGAMHTREDGSLGVGLFELGDVSFDPKVEALIRFLDEELADFSSPDGFSPTPLPTP